MAAAAILDFENLIFFWQFKIVAAAILKYQKNEIYPQHQF